MAAKAGEALMREETSTSEQPAWEMLAQMGGALADLEPGELTSGTLEKLARAELGLVACFWQVIPSTLPAIDRVIARVRRMARAMDVSPRELNKVEIPLREALNNAMVHGNGSDPRKKIYVCCLCTQDHGILLVVRDSGRGFDASRVPDPTIGDRLLAASGRGIYIMRQLMDEVRFEMGGRQVVMKKAGWRTNGRYSKEFNLPS